MADTTLAALDALGRASVDLNKRAVKQKQAADQIQAEVALGQAAPNVSARRAAQTVAPALAAQQSQAATAGATQTTQALASNAQQAAQTEAFQGRRHLAETELAQRGDLANRRREQDAQITRSGMQLQREITGKEQVQAERLAKAGIEQDNSLLQMSLDMRRTLNSLGADLEDKLFDARRRFTEDEMGRKFSNERQLADYAVTSARDNLEFEARMQDMAAAARKRDMLVEASYNKILQTLELDAARENTILSQDTRRELVKMKQQWEKKKAREKAKSSAITTILGAAGMIVGGIYGGPGGAMAGGAVGTAVGAGIANHQSGEG